MSFGDHSLLPMAQKSQTLCSSSYLPDPMTPLHAVEIFRGLPCSITSRNNHEDGIYIPPEDLERNKEVFKCSDEAHLGTLLNVFIKRV